MISDADLSMEIGAYYFNLYGVGEYDLIRAEHYFKRAITLDPEVPDAWHHLARIDFLNGNFHEAIEKINRQIEIHGDDFIASYYIRGLVYGFMGDYKNAEEDFLIFLELTPGNWAALNDLAWVYFQSGQYEKTLATVEGGLVVEPDNTWLLNMKGLALLNLKRPNEARVFFEKARTQAALLSEEDWHQAYPGNNPSVATQGLFEMRKAIEHNMTLVSVDN